MRNKLSLLARIGRSAFPVIDCNLIFRHSIKHISTTASGDYWSKAGLHFNFGVHHRSNFPIWQRRAVFNYKQKQVFLFGGQAIGNLRPKHTTSYILDCAFFLQKDLRPYSTYSSEAVEDCAGSVLEKEGDKKHSSTMAEGSSTSHRENKEGELLYPAVDTYGPITIRGDELQPGKKKKWCTCGLSKKAPWCDGAHKKTGFRSLKWEVPEKPQSIYQICNCQYTKSPPFCDGTHVNLPEEVLERQKNCANKPNHEECLKMCTGCGWKVDF